MNDNNLIADFLIEPTMNGTQGSVSKNAVKSFLLGIIHEEAGASNIQVLEDQIKQKVQYPLIYLF